MTQVTQTGLDLILKVGVEGSQKEYRCLNHSSTFSINRIPLASVGIPVGRNTRSLEKATIHESDNEFKHMAPCEVVLRPSKYWATWRHLDGDIFPFDEGLWETTGERVVFRGYITGLGQHKTRGGFQVSFQLIHWLADLAFSSIFSNQSHPSNPNSFTFPAVHRDRDDAAGTAGSRRDFIGGTRYASLLNRAVIKEDLWKGLGNLFCVMAEEDSILVEGDVGCGGLGGGAAGGAAFNSHSLDALARIEGDHDCTVTGTRTLPSGIVVRERVVPSHWHVPLKLSGPDMGGLLADAIRWYIANQRMDSAWSTTIWDKLVHDFAPAFAFTIVPRVESAVIAPFVPGLRDTYRVSLEPEDISSHSLSSYMRRPLRAVGVYAGREWQTVATDRTTDEIFERVGIGGCYMPDPDAKGIVLIRRAPSWMVNIPYVGTKASRTVLGAGGEGGDGRRATSSATTPTSEAMVGDARGKTASEVAVESANIYERLAHYMYVKEVLRGREGTIGSKLRYDIAPGANVLFVTNRGLHIEDDWLAGEFVGSVMRVTCEIDAEQRRAGSRFTLAHIRTDAENRDDRTSIDSHPLYEGQVFRGAPLVDDYLFDL